MQRLQGELEKSRIERQNLEISFKERASDLGRKLTENQNRLEEATRNKSKVEEKIEENRKQFEEELQRKEEEIEILRKNQEIKENEKGSWEVKMKELESGKVTEDRIEELEEELRREKQQKGILEAEFASQKAELEKRNLLVQDLQKENKSTSNNLQTINSKIVEKLDVLEKQRESCPKHLTNLKEIQDSIRKLNSELTGLRSENQRLLEGRQNWFHEIKSELQKMKESQLRIQPQKRRSSEKGPILSKRLPTPPVVYRKESTVVRN